MPLGSTPNTAKKKKIAEAGLKPVILLSQSPKYWDYRHALPHPAPLFFFAVLGIEPRGILPPSYTPSPIFLFFILKQGLTKLRRASLSCRGWPWTMDSPVSASQVLGLQACTTMPSFHYILLPHTFVDTNIQIQVHNLRALQKMYVLKLSRLFFCLLWKKPVDALYLVPLEP